MQELFQDIAQLPEDRRELFKLLLHEAEIDVLSLPIVPLSGAGNIFPLSFAQQGLWFLQRLTRDDASYNEPVAVQIVGTLDIAVLERSFTEIVRRQQILRTRFPLVDAQPMQVIERLTTVRLPVVDLTTVAVADRQAEVARIAARHVQQPFDLETGPLLRTTLLWLGAHEHVLLVTLHHIIMDGWSMGVFLEELVALYEAFAADRTHSADTGLPELAVQYADFACWQHSWLSGQVLASQLAYWTRQLAQLPVLALPTDRPRPAVQSFQGTRYSFMLPQALSEAIKQLRQQPNDTLFITLVTAFLMLLHYYTDQDDLVVGTDVAYRNRAETERLIGLFVNQLVLRADVAGDPSFFEQLERVRETALEAYANQDVPFSRVVEALQIERDLSRTPLFQVKFVLQNAPMPPLELPGLTLQLLEVERGTAKFDMLWNLWETSDGLVGAIDYSTMLFDAATVAHMVAQFELLLQHIVANPALKLSELIALLASADTQQRRARRTERKAANLQKLTALKRRDRSRT